MALFTDVILPILLIIGAGALVQKHHPMHIQSLSRLTIFLLVPTFLFVKIYQSTLSWTQIGGIMITVLIPMALVGFPMAWVLRKRAVPGTTIGAMLLGSLVFNAGNIGLPVAAFFYQAHGKIFQGMKTPEDGVAVQALVVMASNISIWLVGYGIIAMAKGDGLRGTLGFFKLPMIYVIVAAFLLRETDTKLPESVENWLIMLAAPTVPIMLLTLGAQLTQNARWPNWKRVLPVMSVKLMVLPAVTAAVVVMLGLWPWPGAQLVIASAAPAAVNTLLLSLQLEADAETAADCVFWTTLASAITLTATLAIVVAVAG